MAEIQIFVFRDEAIQLVNQFANECKAKAILLEEDNVQSGEANSKKFLQIVHTSGVFFLVKTDVPVDKNLLDLRPRDEDWIMVLLANEYKEGDTPVLLMSSFFAKSRGLGLKFNRWFQKYYVENKMRIGVNGLLLGEKNLHFYNDIYYSHEARLFLEAKGVWKQVMEAPTVFFPGDMTIEEYFDR